VTVDWLFLVAVGTIGAVPVTYGESPTCCAAVIFQLLAADGSRNAHCGIRVPAGMGSGKNLGAPIDVQLRVHAKYVIHGSP